MMAEEDIKRMTTWEYEMWLNQLIQKHTIKLGYDKLKQNYVTNQKSDENQIQAPISHNRTKRSGKN